MGTLTMIGIDLAKSVFQLHGVDQKGKKLFSKKLTRTKFIEFVANLNPCTLVMEACGGSNYFARKFKSFGHETKLIAPQFVKPFVKTNKNDAADAQAISEAAQRPDMNFVPPKTVEQQDLQFIHRVRSRQVRNRTALMNEMRGMLTEYGIVCATGRLALDKICYQCLNDQVESELSAQGKHLLQALYSELIELDAKITDRENELKRISLKSEKAKLLDQIGGIGLMTKTCLMVALADPGQFKNGRQFAAWVGLVPKHSGSGGKNKVHGLSKRGDAYLRTLLVHGARAKLRVAIQKEASGNKLDPLEQWVCRLYHKVGQNKASVALANKNARVAWSIMESGKPYDVNKAAQARKKILQE